MELKLSVRTGLLLALEALLQLPRRQVACEQRARGEGGSRKGAARPRRAEVGHKIKMVHRARQIWILDTGSLFSR
jgi:hypothetical protein